MKMISISSLNSPTLSQIQTSWQLSLSIQVINGKTKPTLTMYRNYLKVGLRTLLRQKVYAFINILGLSIAITSCSLIMLYVENELSYDKFNLKKDRLFKIGLERKYPDYTTFYDVIPSSFMEVMVNDFPEVAGGTRLINFTSGDNFTMVRFTNEGNDPKAFEESKFVAADSSFFDLFSIAILKGDKESALRGPNKIVLTEETAKKYFGNSNPIGRTLETGFGDFEITAICENLPETTHLDFDLLASLPTFQFFSRPNFYGFSSHTYLELNPGASATELESKFPAMVDKYAAPQIEQRLNISYSDYVEAGNGYRYVMRPVIDIHLDPTNYEGKMKPGGNRTYVNSFISITILILLVACMNFINLSTARSAERAKEVGIRKSMGSLRSQLIVQFLMESILISVFSMLIAIGLVYLVLPEFNALAQKQFEINMTGSRIIIMMLLFTLIAGILAGSYPAFVVSAF